MSKERLEHYVLSEEEFHADERKASRKERKRKQAADRSKFKKTDLAKTIAPTTPNDPALRQGRVISISVRGALVATETKNYLCSLRGLLKKEKIQTNNLLAVGDQVRFLPTSEDEGAIAFIEPRHSFLVRQDIRGTQEQLIAVNIDLAILVFSLVSPPLKPSLIDRYLIAAEKGHILPLIVINKIDLLPDASLQEREKYEQTLTVYRKLKIPILPVSSTTGEGLEALKAQMHNHCSAFAGQSGVGKSSLLNQLFGFQLKTGILTEKTHKGSHTTSVAELFALPGGGYCIDTPGVRSFSLWEFTQADILHHFKEIRASAKRCKYSDCLHREEPNCAVRRALKRGTISSLRFASYLSLLEETEHKELRR